MRIGVVVNIDNRTILPFLEEKDKHVVQNCCYGTCAPSVNTLIHSFLKAGHYVRIFTDAKQGFHVASESVEVYAVKEYKQYPLKFFIGEIVVANRLSAIIDGHFKDLDVLHAHWTYKYALAASRFADNIPVFCTVRDWAALIWRMESMKNRVVWTVKFLISEYLYGRKNLIFLGNSEYTARLVSNKIGKEVPVIPNSIKDDFIRTEPKTSLSGIKILCISSSDDKRKNVVTLLRAFQIILKRRPEAKLRLVGTPFSSENPNMKKWGKEGLLHNVELLGKIEHRNLASIIDESTLYVAPSLEETFGNTLLEAIVRKVPVIGGKNSGAVPSVLHNGKAGFLCDVSCQHDLANMIEYVITHKDETAKVVDDAYDIILSEYKEKVVCNKHIETYQRFINACF